MPVHHRPRAMMAAVGTAVPMITPMPVQRADFSDPAREEAVTAQKMTSMTGTRNALFWARSGVDHVRGRGGQEHQHGGEPHDVLGPVAPYGQEPPPGPERLPDPPVHAAAHGGGQLGRAQRHRHQVRGHGDGVEEDRRPAERGRGGQVPDAVHGRDQHQRQPRHPQPPGAGPGLTRPGLSDRLDHRRHDTSSLDVGAGAGVFGVMNRPTTGSSATDSARAMARPALGR